MENEPNLLNRINHINKINENKPWEYTKLKCCFVLAYTISVNENIHPYRIILNFYYNIINNNNNNNQIIYFFSQKSIVTLNKLKILD